MRWAIGQEGNWPELALLHAIPNGGLRSKRTAATLKRTGVKAGVPDLCLPIARGGFHGLYLEMKRRTGGRVEPEQKAWHARLSAEGYQVTVCRGHEQAIAVIRDYLAADGCPDDAQGPEAQNEGHAPIAASIARARSGEATDAAA